MPQTYPIPSRSVSHFPVSTTIRRAASNPFLSALECDFRHPDDGRKWAYRCGLKRQICRGYAKLGLSATECRLSRFLGIPGRTVRRVIGILIKQGFISNVRRLGYNGPMLRRMHAGKLLAFVECGRPTRGECGRVKTPKTPVRRSSGFARAGRQIPQELGKTENRAINRRSSVPLFPRKPLLPQQVAYRQIGQLAAAAVSLFHRAAKPDLGELADALKWWAAEKGIDYSRTLAGGDDPISKAIIIAERRLGDPFGRFTPFKRRL